MKKTKIVATLGPATDSETKIKELIEAGVDVFRLNFSHGTHESQGEKFDRIRSISDDVGIMLDTKGPEVRTGQMEDNTSFDGGSKVKLTSEDVKGDSGLLPVSFDGLEEGLETGDNVLIDDGKVILEVVSTENGVQCEVEHGGPVETGKGVNVPGKDIGLQAPTEKDVEDIKFGLEKGFDFIALSFVKHEDDVKEVRDLIDKHESSPEIISKIEHLKAVDNFDGILDESDGIMVARGDLGVEANAAEVPLLQKEQVRKANSSGKPVIIATQMLESMTENPMATRAEASDVANAVIDGTDAVMLSGESAIGDYPVRAVEFMSEIIERTEKIHDSTVHHTVKDKSSDATQVICKNAWQAARDLDASYIMAHTTSGSTARNIAKYRPGTPIVGISHDKEVVRKMNLIWGVQPVHIEETQGVGEMVRTSVSKIYDEGWVDANDQLIISAGVPTGISGATNMLQIRKTVDVLEEQN